MYVASGGFGFRGPLLPSRRLASSPAYHRQTSPARAWPTWLVMPARCGGPLDSCGVALPAALHVAGSHDSLPYLARWSRPAAISKFVLVYAAELAEAIDRSKH